MVEREFRATLLALLDKYSNLVRKTTCEATTFAGVLPCRLSFTRTCAHLLELRLWLASGPLRSEDLLRYLGSLVIPERLGRLEPRVLKRRRHRYPLMKKPRHLLKQIQMRKLP